VAAPIVHGDRLAGFGAIEDERLAQQGAGEQRVGGDLVVPCRDIPGVLDEAVGEVGFGHRGLL
jgi:hypothetical protein